MRGKNVPERGGSRCKGLGAGMDLPRAETWSTGPRTDQPPRSPTFLRLRWQTEIRNTFTGKSGPWTLGVSISGTWMSKDILGPF